MKKTFFLCLFLMATCLNFADQSVRVDFSKFHLKADASKGKADVTFANGVFFNIHGSNWVMHIPGESYIKLKFEKDKKSNGAATLYLTHTVPYVGRECYAPISILVNDQVVVSGFSPKSYQYMTDAFDITEFLQEGKNTVVLKFDPLAASNYWIKGLQIYLTK
jgi:hypothetical protein